MNNIQACAIHGLTQLLTYRPTAWQEDPSIVDRWNILGWKIDECLVREVPLEEKCSVSYSLEILIGMAIR